MQKKDLTVTPQRILELSSPTGIVSFFAERGYATLQAQEAAVDDARIQQQLHTREEVNRRIRGFRRVAQNTDETGATLFVYLYVLSSVTLKVKQDIVHDLLSRGYGYYFLLLTSDTNPYQEIEFLFIDPVTSEVQLALDATSMPAPVRGREVVRSLPVDCRHPDYRAVHLLSDLAYKGPSVFEQCKLISNAFSRAETSQEFFHNRSLFSDHYLLNRLPKEEVVLPEWTLSTKLGREGDRLTDAYNRLRTLYSGAAKKLAGATMTKMREQLFDDVFELLGFKWEAGRKGAGTETRVPDYYLYEQQADDLQAGLFALVYPWERNLDDVQSDTGNAKDALYSDDPLKSENPGAVAVSLLEQEHANWAIVTNGKQWRLYSAKARSRSTNYYEIDLQEALLVRRDHTDDALTGLRYFWLFFRADAFKPLPRAGYETPPYPCFLDVLMRKSEEFALALGNDLKERIFDDIFPYFAHGFVSYAQAHGRFPTDVSATSEEERARLLQPFFDGTLTFLYRLLVVFYAESRDLLPVDDVAYSQYSVKRLKEEITAVAKNNRDQATKNIHTHYSASETGLYDRLLTLFAAIDKGNEDLNVPTYNGGLFVTEIEEGRPESLWTPEEQVARFLSLNKIPDRYLAWGFDLMARDEDEKKSKTAKPSFELVYVDYKSLGVRQLGSIYEGLLEFKLRIAVERMALVKGKVIPLREALAAGQYRQGKTDVYEPNDIYIENDRHERKATGSYYTPDYIVKYIIEQTVGPILQEKFKQLRPRFQEYQRTLQSRRRENEEFRRRGMPLKDLDRADERFADLFEELFDIKVLDPAMGSGHFLVDTVDYITDKVTEYLRPLSPNPVQKRLLEIRDTIAAEVEKQGVSIDRGKLTELNLLKRQVLKRCVFGVDVNRMAVELTRVSLWLDTFTVGAPFSFLDYHLKWGNSLLGCNLEVVERALRGRVYSLDIANLLSSVHITRLLSNGTDSTIEQLREARQQHEVILGKLQPYKRLMNVWVSCYFGNTIVEKKRGKTVVKDGRSVIDTNAKFILDGDDARLDSDSLQIVQAAPAIAAPTHKNFFHWDLEFPEAFFQENHRLEEDQAGFDAIIGNPPYVRQEGLSDDKSAFKDLFPDSYSSIADLYTYFIERGHKMLRRGGRFGMITANKFIRANYGAGLRTYLAEQVRLEKLIDFGDLPVFGDATTYPVIVISSKIERDAKPVEYVLIKNLDFESLSIVVESDANKIEGTAFHGSLWSLSSTANQQVLKRLHDNCVLLEGFIDGKIRYGIKTGFNEAFIIDNVIRNRLIAQDSKSAEIIKPLLLGEDVHKYALDYQGRYLIWTYIGIPIANYPAIFGHLQQYQMPLEKRWDKGNHWWELRHCDYYSDFEKPKVIFPDIADGSQFAYSTVKEFSGNTTYFFVNDNLFLLAVLNSAPIEFFYRSKTAVYRGGYLRFFTQYVNETPIRRINFVTPASDRACRLKDARALYEQHIGRDTTPILQFVERQLAMQPEASDVVHDVLAWLAEEMLRLNREKRALQQTFLSYLATTFKIQQQPDKDGRTGIDALQPGRARLVNFAGDYQKDEPSLGFANIGNLLLENKRRLGVAPPRAGDAVLRLAEREYEASMAAIGPIKARLKWTDRLIDEVVYRLYGLTEDEVRVVEGKE